MRQAAMRHTQIPEMRHIGLYCHNHVPSQPITFFAACRLISPVTVGIHVSGACIVSKIISDNGW